MSFFVFFFRLRRGLFCSCFQWITGKSFKIAQWNHRLHCAGEIWKRSFISTAWLTVHTNSSRKRVLSKTLLKPEEFENAGLAFSRVRKTFWKRSFSKTMTSRSSRDYPERRFLKHKSKMAGVVGFLNSYGVVWTENIWCVKYPNNFSPSLRAWRVLTNAC